MFNLQKKEARQAGLAILGIGALVHVLPGTLGGIASTVTPIFGLTIQTIIGAAGIVYVVLLWQRV